MKAIVFIVVLIILLAFPAGGVIGYSVGRAAAEPTIVEVEVTKIETEVVYVPDFIVSYHEVEKIVEVERVVEKIVEIPPTIKPWLSEEEFLLWYASYLPLMRGVTIFNEGADCDDYAETLQRAGIWDGRYISQLPTPDYSHMMTLINIGNYYYIVEPQPDIFMMKKIPNLVRD